MIIRFFKSSYLPQYVALILIGMALWAPALFWSDPDSKEHIDLLEPGYHLLLSLFPNYTFIGILFSFLITMGTALLFNFVLEKHDLTSRNSLLPAFVFIVFTGLFPELHGLHQSLIPTLLILLLLNNILEMYNVDEGYTQIFYAGVLIAIASLFSFQSLFYILLVFLAFFVFRIYTWREWIIVLLGVVNVYLLLGVYLFWTDKLNLALQNYGIYFTEISFYKFQGPYDFISLLLITMTIILSLWSLLKVLVRYSDHILVIRKKITVILWFFFTAVLITIISGRANETFNYLLITALASITCIGLVQLKKTIWMDVTLGIFLILALINNYSQLLS